MHFMQFRQEKNCVLTDFVHVLHTMTRFQQALANWLREKSHTQTLFQEITGINRSTVSRLMDRPSGLTRDQRPAIFNGFTRIGDPAAGLCLIIADLKDSIPNPILDHVEVRLKDHTRLAQKGEPVTLTDRAKRQLLDALVNNDPDTIALAIALHQWDKRNK